MRKQQKIKAKDTGNNQSENKKSNIFFTVRQNVTEWGKKDKSKSKRQQKRDQLFRD